MMIEMTDCAVGGAAKDVDGAILRRIRGGEPEACSAHRVKPRSFPSCAGTSATAPGWRISRRKRSSRLGEPLDQFSTKSPLSIGSPALQPTWLAIICAGWVAAFAKQALNLGEDTLDWLDAGRGGRQPERGASTVGLWARAPHADQPHGAHHAGDRRPQSQRVSELTGLSVSSVEIRCHRAGQMRRHWRNSVTAIAPPRMTAAVAHGAGAPSHFLALRALLRDKIAACYFRQFYWRCCLSAIFPPPFSRPARPGGYHR